MKTLTLTEPWASLVALGEKKIETRSWSDAFRGPIAIHAGKKMTRDDLDFAQENDGYFPFERSPFRCHAVKDAFPDTRGCVIAVARLVAVVPTRDANATGRLVYAGKALVLSEQEQSFGNYAPGRYAWVFEDVIRLPEPIPAKGERQLWEWEPPAGLLDSLGIGAGRQLAGVGR